MSLNQLISQNRKEWCKIRCEDLRCQNIIIDKSFGQQFNGTINYTQGVTTTAAYSAKKIGNYVFLTLAKVQSATNTNTALNIIGTPDQLFVDNLLPSEDYENTCVVTEQSDSKVGKIKVLALNGEIQVSVGYNKIKAGGGPFATADDLYTYIANSSNNSTEFRPYNINLTNSGWDEEINIFYSVN